MVSYSPLNRDRSYSSSPRGREPCARVDSRLGIVLGVVHWNWVHRRRREHCDESDGAVGRVFSWADVFALVFAASFTESHELPAFT